MNINSFDGYAGTAKYMTRSDWNGTYPTTVAGLTAKNRIETLLKNNFIDVKNNDDVSAYKWGVNSWKTDENGKPTNHEAIHITEMKGADFNDPRWNKIVDQVSISEFLSFAGKAFHTLAGIPSVGLSEYKTDDGPGGSDGGKIKDAMYQDGLSITVIRTASELKHEAIQMHNCSAGYIDRIIQGSCVIFKIRRTEEPDQAFYMLELSRDKRIIQCRGIRNSSSTPEVEAFLEKWKTAKFN